MPAEIPTPPGGGVIDTPTPVPPGASSPMSLVNAKKSLPAYNTAALVAARLRRRGGASRLGRRSALMGVLSSIYANTSTSRATSLTAPTRGLEARPATS